MINAEGIRSWADRKGYRVALGGVSLLEEVRDSLRRRRESGDIEAFFGITSHSCPSEKDPAPNARSIIIVAVPAPAYTLKFTVGGREIETILPPTYVRYRAIFEDVRDDLAKALAGSGFRVKLLNAPLKALGNRLGLVSHGRNNIGYIDGWGSYFQLVGLVSDLPLDEKDAPPPRPETLLPRCRKCRICSAACPLGVIEKERVLIHAEKCYVLFSESAKPFPEGLKPPSPKCLIGCLRCQELCPEDKGLLRTEEAEVSFDEEETQAFLGLKPAADGPAYERALAKFRKLGLTEGLPLYRRNLGRLLRNLGVSPPSSV
jgi:epoxyqueuosine reductase